MSERTILVVGGTSGFGLAVATSIVAHGENVILTGRDLGRAGDVAASLGERATGLALDLTEPEGIADQLAGVGNINGIILAAVERDANSVRDFSLDRARKMVTIKLVAYIEVVHTLLDRLENSESSGIVLFGGRAKDAPYPGSTMVTAVNAGVVGVVNTLAVELAPIRVNGIHPGIIGDSPVWAGAPSEVLSGYEKRTPGGSLATTAHVVNTVGFLMGNRGLSGQNIVVDRGWRLT